MRGVLRRWIPAVALIASGYPAGAESPKVYLFDVLRRPEYPQAYNRMLRGESNLPSWFGSARAAGSGTTDAGTIVRIDGREQELYSFCEPHNCGGHFFAVLFSGDGQRAVGASDIEGRIRMYGNPTPAESQVLVRSLRSSE